MAKYRPGIVFIGMETSGTLRRRYQAAGYETYSCDLRPSQDGGEEMAYSDDGLPLGRHIVGDVFLTLDNMWACDLWPDVAVFHPDCTYLTNSAAWAFGDGPYHQKVKPGTLVGQARRDARDAAAETFMQCVKLPIRIKVIENPIGAMSSRFRKPSQIVQPYEFGDDASKATCLWFVEKDGAALDFRLPLDPARRFPGRMVGGIARIWNGAQFVEGRNSVRERWSNQTDSGQNRLTPGEDRWQLRSDTYPGIADAIVKAIHP
jgi:hypothetical protein